MIRMARRGTSAAIFLLTGALVTGTLAPAAASAAASAPVPPPVAGWVVSAPRVRNVTVTVVVPRLTCHGTRATAVTLGMFGFMRDGSGVTPWQMSVVASCHRGNASYVAVALEGRDTEDRVRVRPGDRVRLGKHTASEYEIDDITSGSGVAGATGSTGPGAEPVLINPVVFGGVERGPGHPALRVHLTHARVNHVSADRIDPHRQRQVVGGRVVAAPRAIQRGGDFGVVINP